MTEKLTLEGLDMPKSLKRLDKIQKEVTTEEVGSFQPKKPKTIAPEVPSWTPPSAEELRARQKSPYLGQDLGKDTLLYFKKEGDKYGRKNT